MSQTINKLLSRLTILAASYRGTANQDRTRITQEYHHAMQVLYDLGWDEMVDFEASLPDKDMPERYQKKYAKQGKLNAGWLLDRAR